MAIQVNVRLDEEEWERVVVAMPGLSNGERMARLVRQQITLADSRRDLARALELIETALEPTRQLLRRQRLAGQGSELAEELAESVIELAALLLAQTEGLEKVPQKALPELEAKLARRWARTASQILRMALLDPELVRQREGALAELQRLARQIRDLPLPGAAATLGERVGGG